VIGSKIRENDEVIREIIDNGHLIGNHSWSHSPMFDFYTSKRMKRELIKTADMIRKHTGHSPLLFRPPFGVINPMVTGALKKLPYHVIGWSIRSMDTILKDPGKITGHIMKRVKPGAVILLHDPLPDSHVTLKLLIEELKARNYRIISLTELFQIEAYA